jgi:hypothetical protein
MAAAACKKLDATPLRGQGCRKDGGMRRIAQTFLVAALTLAMWACQAIDPKAGAERAEYLESIRQAKALYEDRCAKVAGEKIYKTVHNVDRVLLLNIPAMGSEREWFQRDWPGAAFAEQRAGGLEGLLNHFLWYEERLAGGMRTITAAKTDLPGYRYVDVFDEKDGQRYRYTGSMKATGKKDVNAEGVRRELARDPNYDLNVYNYKLDRVIAPEKPTSRYGIRFEDHVIPEERALWVASGTIKVIDLQTMEVLGEMTRYAIAYTRPGPGASPPWLRVKICGGQGLANVDRTFVDQVLKPAKGE